MITATAAEVSKAIVDDPTLLRALHGFVEKVTGDADIGARAIAAHSPFVDEAAMTETVKREMLLALHAIALRALPAKGTA